MVGQFLDTMIVASSENTGSPSSLGIGQRALRNSVIVRVCMGNISIVGNSSK